MQAVVITQFGGPEVLDLRAVPDPVPAADEVLVAVKYTAVNRLDLLQRLGLYPAPEGAPVDIPGVEFAGTVESTGSAVTRFRAGDRVFGLVGGGSYAQYIVAHERTIMPIPKTISFQQAAAIPEAFMTAFDALVVHGQLKKGETALISAAGSGVGAAAVQVARVFGAHTIGTARSAGKIEKALALGLEHGIVARECKFAQDVLALTGDKGVDVVLELVGGLYISEDIACMASKGRLIIVGLVGGARCEINLGTVLRKRLEIRGTVMRSRTLEEKVSITEQFSSLMLPLIAAGKVSAVIDQVLPLAKAAEAHVYVGKNENFGKVLLELPV